MKTISVVIPTYNRPAALARCLESLLQVPVEEIIVIDDSLSGARDENERVIASAAQRETENGCVEIRHIIQFSRTSAPVARNTGIRMARGEIVLMLDDDMVLASVEAVDAIKEDFSRYMVGAVCGKIVEVNPRVVDPPFYLNSRLAGLLNKLLGFIFLNVKPGLRLVDFGTAVMAIRREALEALRYDERFEGTSYREETDVQQQLKTKGWKILFDSRLSVFHYACEEGGNRGQELKERMYWKAKNHTIYLRKHYKRRRYWYFLAGLLILLFYTPTNLSAILRGFRDGQTTI